VHIGRAVLRSKTFAAAMQAFIAFCLRAQAPAVIEEYSTAHNAALGGAGIAVQSQADGRFLNPALLAGVAPLAFSTGVYRVAVIDVVEVRAGVIASFAKWGDVSIDIRSHRVEKLLEDSTLAADPAFRVEDFGVRVGYALHHRGRCCLVGIAAERVSSMVFGTTGAGWNIAVGAALSMSRRLSLGFAAVRLGPDYRWVDGLGERTRSSLGRAAVMGLSLDQPLGRWMHGTARLDVETPLQQGAPSAVRTGVSLTLASLLGLHAGMERTRVHGSQQESTFGGGASLVFGGATVDVARDHIGAAVGERTLLGLTLAVR
jgi:hypothetical protein